MSPCLPAVPPRRAFRRASTERGGYSADIRVIRFIREIRG
jgi:hypothetical protein